MNRITLHYAFQIFETKQHLGKYVASYEEYYQWYTDTLIYAVDRGVCDLVEDYDEANWVNLELKSIYEIRIVT